LWRLRRATAIETDLLRIQAEILRDRQDQRRSHDQLERPQTIRLLALDAALPPAMRDEPRDSWNDNDPRVSDHDACGTRSAIAAVNPSRDLAHCFQRLANLDNGVFERLGRYETALWRQMAQTVFVLQSARRR
jgi:hypothetical protein